MGKQEELMQILPREIRAAAETSDWKALREIRLRVGKPLILCGETEQILPHTVTEQEIRECLQAAARYSLYAYEDQIRQGFLTVKGGHRVGLAGHVIWEEERIRTMKQVSSLNIRAAHEVKGCADRLARELFGDGKPKSVLLISPPGAGKTTCLRELIRLLSEGETAAGPLSVGVVDERSELAACYQGIPQNDLGKRSDVLDGCPKAEGIYMLLRSMAPQVIAVDEISLPEDAAAVACAAGCGCRFLATAHGTGPEILQRPAFRELREDRVFERYVVLGDPPGRVLGIYDAGGHLPGGRR